MYWVLVLKEKQIAVDREDMKQPRGVDDLIYKILDVNKSVCIVAQSGTQTEMPWADKVPSLAQVRGSAHTFDDNLLKTYVVMTSGFLWW